MGGAVGWESTNHEQVRAKTYGFDKTMELATVDQAVFLAQLKDAKTSRSRSSSITGRRNGFSPNTSSSKLQQPPFDGYTTEDAKGTDRYNPNGCYTFYQPAQRNDWLEASNIKCGQPPTRVNIAYSSDSTSATPKSGSS